jgi:hypothetical protein
MRTLLLFPLALAAAAAGACGTASDGTEQAAFRAPRRDLTLSQAETPELEVASPVELARAPVQRPTAHRPQRARRPAPVPRPVATRPGDAPVAPAPVPAPTHAAPALLAAGTVSEAPDPHALAPGRTVTLIPVSNGPSSNEPADTPTGTDQRPDDDGPETGIHGGGHGGGCKPGGVGGHPGGGWGGDFRGLR